MTVATIPTVETLMDEFAQYVLKELSVDENVEAGSTEFFESVGVDPMEFASAWWDFAPECLKQSVYLQITAYSFERAYDEMKSQIIIMKRDRSTEQLQFVAMMPFQEIISDHLGFHYGLRRDGLEKLFKIVADNFE